jgi:hypothetical protein
MTRSRAHSPQQAQANLRDNPLAQESRPRRTTAPRLLDAHPKIDASFEPSFVAFGQTWRLTRELHQGLEHAWFLLGPQHQITMASLC